MIMTEFEAWCTLLNYYSSSTVLPMDTVVLIANLSLSA